MGDRRGDTFIRAVIAGYEISNRIGAAVNPRHYEFWHTTGTVGTLGAAIAASCALRLSVEQAAWALGHATSLAAGLQQAFRSDGMTKPLHAGRAAEGGLLAARAAKAGLVGARTMLAGEVGFVGQCQVTWICIASSPPYRAARQSPRPRSSASPPAVTPSRLPMPRSSLPDGRISRSTRFEALRSEPMRRPSMSPASPFRRPSSKPASACHSASAWLC